MSDASAWSSLSDAQRAAAIAALVAQGRDVTWLDGGAASRGIVAFDADEVIESDDPGAIAAIDRRWHHDAGAVWTGCISYDFAADLVLGRTPRVRALPGIVMRRSRSWIECGPAGVRSFGTPPEPPTGLDVPPAWPLGPLAAIWSAPTYRAKVTEAKRHIVAGDTYQVNLAQRFFAPWREQVAAADLPQRAAALYLRLRGKAPAERGALVRLPAGFVISNSPETLVDVDVDARGVAVAHARPIKGTRPRASTPEADRAARAELRGSAKDLAEHVMIVDLVRNDLGRLAEPGSVHAPSRPDDLALPTVHHLVSEIRATLRPGIGLAELCAALVPGGSVTGAPKRRTLEIIEALEECPRGIYCGAIVLLEAAGVRMSIPIRTGLLDTRGLSLHAGGGIVADSEPEAERQESVAKTRAFEP